MIDTQVYPYQFERLGTIYAQIEMKLYFFYTHTSIYLSPSLPIQSKPYIVCNT